MEPIELTEQDMVDWCDESLHAVYNPGMFDSEEISETVWEAVHELLEPFEDELNQQQSQLFLSVIEEWFQTHHSIVIDAIESVSSDALSVLCSRPQVAQHSKEWYDEKKTCCLSSSEFHQILDGRRDALIRKKVQLILEQPEPEPGEPEPEPKELNEFALGEPASAIPVAISQEDGDMNALMWGHRFESITRRIFEEELAGVGTVCDSLGRFKHETIPFLRASLDGLILKGPLQGRLVEIKSPKTRIPGEFVKDDYYSQMQIQMEVTGLDAVEFVEAQFKQKHKAALTPDDLAEINQAPWKGELQVRGVLEDRNTWYYVYSDPVEELKDVTLTNTSTNTDGVLEHSVWWLTGFSPRTVLRNQEWWETVGYPNTVKFEADLRERVEQEKQNPTRTNRVTVEHVDETGGGWMGLP